MGQEIKKLGFNDQILIVSSTILGDTASDTNSFTLRLTRALRNLPTGVGIKIPELEHLKCQLEGGFSTKPTRWLSETWPLGMRSRTNVADVFPEHKAGKYNEQLKKED